MNEKASTEQSSTNYSEQQQQPQRPLKREAAANYAEELELQIRAKEAASKRAKEMERSAAISSTGISDLIASSSNHARAIAGHHPRGGILPPIQQQPQQQQSWGEGSGRGGSGGGGPVSVSPLSFNHPGYGEPYSQQQQQQQPSYFAPAAAPSHPSAFEVEAAASAAAERPRSRQPVSLARASLSLSEGATR
jgi:hypothetical protein